jgi:uncharacterized protein YjbI with pentapeptide repeats
LSGHTHGAVLTHFRLVALAGAALCVAWASQASAFWPFAVAPPRLSMTSTYGGVCEGCNLANRNLTGAKMSNSVFNRSNFSEAVMARADASRSEFQGADFSGADLSGVSFTDADVTRANFDGADITGANLETAAGLTQRQLNAACGDYTTRVPRGMRVRECE